MPIVIDNTQPAKPYLAEVFKTYAKMLPTVIIKERVKTPAPIIACLNKDWTHLLPVTRKEGLLAPMPIFIFGACAIALPVYVLHQFFDGGLLLLVRHLGDPTVVRFLLGVPRERHELVGLQALSLRQLEIEQAETDPTNHLRPMTPFGVPVLNPDRHGLPVFPMPEKAERLRVKSEA